MNYEFTKKMEDDLDKISNGGLDRRELTEDFYKSLLNPVEQMVKKSNEDDWNPYDPEILSNFVLTSTVLMPPYNFIPTTILCTKKGPINIRTGEECTENDPPLLIATKEEIIREIDKNNGDYLMRAVRKSKDGKYFLVCSSPNNDKKNTIKSIFSDLDAWAGKGRKKENALIGLKEAMAQAPKEFFS